MTMDRSFSLAECLADALPEACRFNVHHLSTPPTSCPAIFAAPPGEHPEETYCESHFLSVSIDHGEHQLQVFAIEVLIYTTQSLTTLFVSKADSSGYLHLLKLPQGTPSPLRTISATFLQYLIERRKRSDITVVLSLFARAQNQYLFPGSVENNHKHVLDDRGLIKWWCKIADSLLAKYQTISDVVIGEGKDPIDYNETISAGFLRVPGCDVYETRSFLPNPELKGITKYAWVTADPLQQIRKSNTLPPRCLIPRFPDDPKARFVDTLDDEIPDEDLIPTQSDMLENPSKAKNAGRWRSVRDLDQFWEMMQFRQECSSGRLVGFIWATFQLVRQCREKYVDTVPEHSPNSIEGALPNPATSRQQDNAHSDPSSPLRLKPPRETLGTTPPASPSKTSPVSTPVKIKNAVIQAQPEETKYYYWPTLARGEVVLRQKDYKRIGDQLLRFDYANEETAAISTRRWIGAVAEKAGVTSWGRLVVGTRPMETRIAVNGNPIPTMLSLGLIRKKKRSAEALDGPAEGPETEVKDFGIRTLSGGLVRKKAKFGSHLGPGTSGIVQSNGETDLE